MMNESKDMDLISLLTEVKALGYSVRIFGGVAMLFQRVGVEPSTIHYQDGIDRHFTRSLWGTDGIPETLQLCARRHTQALIDRDEAANSLNGWLY